MVLEGATSVMLGHPERGGRVEMVPDREERTEVVNGLAPPTPTEIPDQRPGGNLRSAELTGATVVSGDALHVSIGARRRR